MQLEGERARLGRSEPRLAVHFRGSKMTNRSVTSHALVFGARRAELQPRRLLSPKFHCAIRAESSTTTKLHPAFAVSSATCFSNSRMRRIKSGNC